MQEATRLSKQVEKLRKSGQYAEALPFAQKVLAIRESELGPAHPEVATSVSDVAVLYWRQGKYMNAEPLFRRALAVREQAFGPEHPEVARSLNNLATLYSNQGRYTDAEPLFRRALAVREKALGPEHPEVARSLYNLASLQSDQGKHVQAEPLVTRALAISEKALGLQHPMGDAAALDAAVMPVRKALRDESGSVAAFKAEARRLDRQLMAPIRSKLGKTRRLLISPDGALNLLPFAALVDERGRYLVENYAISYLGSGRDLLRLDRRGPVAGAPLVVANPNFDSAVVVAQAMPAEARRGTEIPADLGQLRYDPLPATAEEARAIARLLPTARVLLGKAASEDALKQVKSPNILHIATHGFFLEQAPQSAQNPLLRSGLALAGFNSRTSGDDDGALTALELSGLDLRGTRLVVLSACETGLGKWQAARASSASSGLSPWPGRRVSC